MAALNSITLMAPGSLGLNTEKKDVINGPDWATEAKNCVVNRAGRLAARKGWADQTSNPIASTPTIDMMHEYVDESSNTIVISAAAAKIYKDIDDFTDANNDITSTTAPGDDLWQFTDFNNKVIGAQDGEIMVVKTSGDFADITAASGSLPTGRCVHGAFGRVWASNSDNQVLKYSALLDETHWSTGAGSVDMSSVWTNGMDEIVAITSVGAMLVVFGKRHIVMWIDGTGSEIGLNPANMYVNDIIEGTGCISQHSVQVTGEGDILYLSKLGIQLLSRAIAQKNNPIGTITKHIRADMAYYISQETLANVRSGYSPDEGFYILTFPSSNLIVYMNMKRLFQDEEGDFVAPVCIWTISPMPTAILVRDNGDILFGMAGVVGKYGGNVDDAASYNCSFWSSWMAGPEGQEENIKILKGVNAYVQLGASNAVTWRWSFDFGSNTFSETILYTVSSDLAEWGTAEWGTSEFSGATLAIKKTAEGKGEGQFIKVGYTMTVANFDFVLNHITLVATFGRRAT